MSLAANRLILASRTLRLTSLKPSHRTVQTVPSAGTDSAMQAEIVAQVEARILAQKEIYKTTHKPMAEEVDEMWKWIKISFIVAFPICVLSSLKNIFLDDHPHRHHGGEPDYMRIRTKPFPWECEDCELFNLECWNKCRADKAAEAAGH